MRILGVSYSLTEGCSYCVIDNDKIVNLTYLTPKANMDEIVYDDAKHMNIDMISVDIVGIGKSHYEKLKRISKDILVTEQKLNQFQISQVLEQLKCKNRLIGNFPLYIVKSFDNLYYLDYSKYDSKEKIKINAIIIAYYGYMRFKLIDKAKFYSVEIKNKDITPQHDEVHIYFAYEDKNDLCMEIDKLIDLFDENIINDLYTDKDEKVAHITTFREVTQDEINGLFYIFDTNNIKINNLADALWINIDDVL